MSPEEREARTLRTLISRLEADWHVVEKVHERVASAVENARSRDAEFTAVAAAALYLQHFYTSIEKLFLKIAIEMDGRAPSGEDWHRELLEQLSIEVPEIRPALLDPDLHADLDLLRRFRHRVRHAYDSEYDWVEMESVVAAAMRTFDRFPATLKKLIDLMRRIIEDLERQDR